jgi:hypothetical protein
MIKAMGEALLTVTAFVALTLGILAFSLCFTGCSAVQRTSFQWKPGAAPQAVKVYGMCVLHEGDHTFPPVACGDGGDGFIGIFQNLIEPELFDIGPKFNLFSGGGGG